MLLLVGKTCHEVLVTSLVTLEDQLESQKICHKVGFLYALPHSSSVFVTSSMLAYCHLSGANTLYSIEIEKFANFITTQKHIKRCERSCMLRISRACIRP